ncbi:MAG: hypothetical protein S4CHLAM37_09210 [Chlamydiia bacterium]|nr:hypothetical protein [Chlamydiia bacterium]
MAIPVFFTGSRAVLPYRFNNPAVVKIMRGLNFSHESSIGLEATLRKLFNERTTDFQIHDEDSLHFREIESDIPIDTLLVFPGAPSISKWKFSDVLQHRIQKYYDNGLLKVVGVCAGAFFCSRHVVYRERKGTESLINIFKGTCKGPAYRGNEPAYGRANIRVEPLTLLDRKVTCHVTMNGGGYFEIDPESEPVVDVKAVYEHSKEPAIIACRPHPDRPHGAVFMGPHFEYGAQSEAFHSYETLFPEVKGDLAQMRKKLALSEDLRMEALTGYIEELGFS